MINTYGQSTMMRVRPATDAEADKALLREVGRTVFALRQAGLPVQGRRATDELPASCYDQTMDNADTSPATDERGVDRTLIREMLAMSPSERIARLVKEARFVALLDQARRGARRPGSRTQR